MIVLFDLDGRPLLNTRRPYGSDLPPRGGSNIAQLMQDKNPANTFVSDLFVSRTTGGHDIALQVPVYGGSGNGNPGSRPIRYLLSLGMNVGSLQQLLGRQRLPAAWLATLIDRNGLVVARTRAPELYLGKPVRDTTRALVRGVQETMYESRTLDGIDSRVYASTVPGADWKILLSIPRSELRQAPLRAAALLGGMMALLLVVGLVAARRFASRAIAPIDALGRSAMALGTGAEVRYQPAGWAELDSVAHHLADASTRIRQGQTEMEARVAAAIAATERAQSALLKNQKLEALGRLTGGIAHEYNNLLQTLTTALQLAAFTTRDDKVKSLVQTCQRTVARATTLTGQLGSFGRMQEARRTTVDLCEQLRSAVQLMKGSLSGKAAVEVHCTDEVWPVTLEPLQFDVALLNLAMNARDAMPDGGVLRLDASNITIDDNHATLARGDYVLVSMVDSGSGMTPEIMARALDPFFTTKPPGQGTGLGLTQAYAFATQAGGTLVLDSIPGIGTRVDLYLARARDAVLAAPNIGAGAGDDGAAPARGSGTVLFVEDDGLVREAVLRALQESGFEVMVAEDGEAALRLLETDARRPDVVFSDVVMPGQVSGIDLAGILRQRYPDLPVILATGYTEQQVAVPDVQVLAKPYAIEQLVAVLAQAVVHD